MHRRIVGGLLWALFSVGFVEPLSADTHDGDALSAAVAGHAGEPVAPSDTPRPTHDVHLCHCVHSHGAFNPVLIEVETHEVTLKEPRPSHALLAPTSVTLAPPSRPPAPRSRG